MLPSRSIGIVEYVNVAGSRSLAMAFDNKLKAIGEGAELHGQGQTLRNDFTTMICNGGSSTPHGRAEFNAASGTKTSVICTS